MTEHEKVESRAAELGTIRDFVDFLSRHKLVIARRDRIRHVDSAQLHLTADEFAFKFFGIDSAKYRLEQIELDKQSRR